MSISDKGMKFITLFRSCNKICHLPPNNTEFHLGVSGAPTSCLKLLTDSFKLAYNPSYNIILQTAMGVLISGLFNAILVSGIPLSKGPDMCSPKTIKIDCTSFYTCPLLLLTGITVGKIEHVDRQ